MRKNQKLIRKHRSNIKSFKISDFEVGSGNPLFFIAGPCVVEDISICVDIIDTMSELCKRYGINYIFKASYDKANKTIKNSYRGPGWQEGIAFLEKIKSMRDVAILTDVHEKEQCIHASEVADVLQIPALLSKQIDLIVEAAKTGCAINIKRGQFTQPAEANNVISRLNDYGYDKITITDRGYIFGYGTLISDMRSLQIMSLFKAPVIFDGSHAVHGNDTIIEGTNLNHRDFIRPLVRSAVANGVDGIFLEVHPEPDTALSDSIGTFPLRQIEPLLR